MNKIERTAIENAAGERSGAPEWELIFGALQQQQCRARVSGSSRNRPVAVAGAAALQERCRSRIGCVAASGSVAGAWQGQAAALQERKAGSNSEGRTGNLIMINVFSLQFFYCLPHKTSELDFHLVDKMISAPRRIFCFTY